MNLNEFRVHMTSYRRAGDDEATSLKDSYLALDRLHALYEKFSDDERSMADQVLAEWVLSADEKMRFDAIALINDFKIVSAIPALQKLAERLMLSDTPGAPYEIKKIRRVIGSLA